MQGFSFNEERPLRVIRLFQELEDERLLQRCAALAARPASDAELRACHTQAHIDAVETAHARLYPEAEVKPNPLLF